jgi:hypothetical protein
MQLHTLFEIFQRSGQNWHGFFDSASDEFNSEDEDVMNESMMKLVANDSDISDHDNWIDMLAVYLKSVRSPPSRLDGVFKIPQMPLRRLNSIFSQDPRLEDDSDDEEDGEMKSFFFSDSQAETFHVTQDELDIAEEMLQKRRTIKKKDYSI